MTGPWIGRLTFPPARPPGQVHQLGSLQHSGQRLANFAGDDAAPDVAADRDRPLA